MIHIFLSDILIFFSTIVYSQIGSYFIQIFFFGNKKRGSRKYLAEIIKKIYIYKILQENKKKSEIKINLVHEVL